MEKFQLVKLLMLHKVLGDPVKDLVLIVVVVVVEHPYVHTCYLTSVPI